jgi:hypothetical protein
MQVEVAVMEEAHRGPLMLGEAWSAPGRNVLCRRSQDGDVSQPREKFNLEN